MVVLPEYVVGQVLLGLRGETFWMPVWALTAAAETLHDAYVSLSQDRGVIILRKQAAGMKHSSMRSLQTY